MNNGDTLYIGSPENIDWGDIFATLNGHFGKN